jgi:hypothetical protein
MFYIDQKRPADAESVLRSAYNDALEKLKPDDPRRLTVTLRLSEALRELGREESSALEDAVLAEAQKLPKSHPIWSELKTQ